LNFELGAWGLNYIFERGDMMKYRVMATYIFGVQLFAVESDGYILKYCNTREDAEACIKELDTND
jgi:hypothetical protein